MAAGGSEERYDEVPASHIVLLSHDHQQHQPLVPQLPFDQYREKWPHQAWQPALPLPRLPKNTGADPQTHKRLARLPGAGPARATLAARHRPHLRHLGADRAASAQAPGPSPARPATLGRSEPR